VAEVVEDHDQVKAVEVQVAEAMQHQLRHHQEVPMKGPLTLEAVVEQTIKTQEETVYQVMVAQV
jgi:hypothetical protein